MNMKFIPTILLLLILGLFGCDKEYSPKPRGYFRIDLPRGEYVTFNKGCAYRFQYPDYGVITMDTFASKNPCWINLDFPGYRARLHFSYMEIDNNLNILQEDARTLAYKHTIKASAIQERWYENPEEKVYGILYEISGNAASLVQFYMTDSTRHFLRGALYFAVEPNADSLAPVLDHFKKDIVNILETLEWVSD